LKERPRAIERFSGSEDIAGMRAPMVEGDCVDARKRNECWAEEAGREDSKDRYG